VLTDNKLIYELVQQEDLNWKSRILFKIS
jgi:hypothetical protein